MINDILQEYTKRTEAHGKYVSEIEGVMTQSRAHIEELREREKQAFNTIRPEEFKQIQSERATEEATVAMCERRLKELKDERLFTEAELKDYVQQIYEEIESNDDAAVKLVKKFKADLEKLGKAAAEAKEKGNDLILKLEDKTLSAEALNDPVYKNTHLNSDIYKSNPKAAALYYFIRSQFALQEENLDKRF